MGYFAAQHLVKPGGVLSGVLPKPVESWFPVLIGIIAYIISSKISSKNAEKATSALIGQDAPDMELKFKDRNVTLQDFIKEKSLPTVVDFYQNF